MAVAGERMPSLGAVEVLGVAEAADEDLAPSLYGEHIEQIILLKDLVLLSQIRDTPNPVAKEIKDSLWATKKLINQIDVAKLTRAEFEFYVNFVNRIWRSNFDANDFPAAEDGYTYLVMAGHTRAEAMINLEDEKALERTKRGLPESDEEPRVKVKIEEGLDPSRILSLQRNENIHHRPQQEREAMGIVEMYFWGLEFGSWTNKADFLKKNAGKFTKDALNDALHYAELPPSIREFVLVGSVPYRAGVELAKTLPLQCQNTLEKFFGSQSVEDLSDEERAHFEDLILEWLGAEVGHIQYSRQRGRFSGAIIKTHYEAKRKGLQAEISARRELPLANEQPLFIEDFALAEPAEIVEVRRQAEEERIHQEYIEIVKALGGVPLAKLRKALMMHIELLSRDGLAPADDVVGAVEREFVGVLRSYKASREIAGKPDSLFDD